jgi:hypothetical protein
MQRAGVCCRSLSDRDSCGTFATQQPKAIRQRACCMQQACISCPRAHAASCMPRARCVRAHVHVAMSTADTVLACVCGGECKDVYRIALFASLSATGHQYFSLRTNKPPATSQQYFSLRTNQHQSSATNQTNRLIDGS